MPTLATILSALEGWSPKNGMAKTGFAWYIACKAHSGIICICSDSINLPQWQCILSGSIDKALTSMVHAQQLQQGGR